MVDLGKDKYFEATIDAESDSDESYHSLAEELQNITVDQSLRSVNAADSFEFYRADQCRSDPDIHSDVPTAPASDPGVHDDISTAPENIPPTSPRKSDAVQCRPEDAEDSSKASLGTSDSGLSTNSSLARRKEASSRTNLREDSPASTTDPPRDVKDITLEEVLGEDAVVNLPVDDGLDEDDAEEEFDILSLDSVKAKDSEVELKLKDKEVDISVEEMKAALDAAVEQKREGNLLFTGGRYGEAIERYNAGLGICPLGAPQDRAMLYHNRGVAYAKMGEHKLAVASLTKALEHDPQYVKALARRAAEHEAAEDLDAALQDYQHLLELQPSHREAREAVHRLPPKIAERNEKLKAEMMGKLKDLGNMILKPFGMSTDNFQMQQDPKSGGYNIQFKQNP